MAITEADREGYLRSFRSLIQMIGRAARNEAGRVILYADRMTDSIDIAMRETSRRRLVQMEYNEKHGIKPHTISKEVKNLLPELLEEDEEKRSVSDREGSFPRPASKAEIRELERRMWEAVEKLDFEGAAELRDTIKAVEGGLFSGVGLDKNKRRTPAQFKKYRRKSAKK